MAGKRSHIRFLLNEEDVRLDKAPAAQTLLDYLRLEKRLTATKEGCAEGDCGACTVLVGRLFQGTLKYETVNACIRFMGSLDGCHVVTLEHLKRKDAKLHPVQQAMVDYHGSQCGFCTPGFVMSLYALWMENPAPSNQEVEKALQGNLCRCTGYEPIIKAAQAISKIDSPQNDPLVLERQKITQQLQDMQEGSCVEISHGNDKIIIPATLDDLAKARKAYPNSTIVAGSTDVGLWVTKHMRDISPVIFIAHLEELQKIEHHEGGLTINACVTYTQMISCIKSHFPTLLAYWNRIGGEQVRNMGTIGGNIANGSPIGDTPPVLIALGAKVTLRCGDELREIPLEDFFIDYGKQDRIEGDFVQSINIPFLKENETFAAYKISKRFDEDISAVAIAFRLQLEENIVKQITIACGGMAATPKRAKSVEAMLIGKPWNEQTIHQATKAFEEDFSPLSDWRASSNYRALVAKNLLQRFFVEATQGARNTRLQREETTLGVL